MSVVRTPAGTGLDVSRGFGSNGYAGSKLGYKTTVFVQTGYIFTSA